MDFALNHFPVGVVFVHADSAVLFANQAARELLDEGDGLTVSNGVLCASGQRQREKLRAAVTESGRTAPPGTNPTVLRIDRTENERPLILTVVPCRDHEGKAAEPGAAVVFITDPARNGHTPDLMLQTVYSLTGAEIRLAAVLYSGLSLDEAAQKLGVSRHTVSSQVKSIFAKTQTRRQSELLRLLAVLNSQKIAP